MTTDVLYAFCRQSGDVLRMLYKLFQFGVHVIKRREYVDDRPQLFFPEDFVVFLFAPSTTTNPLAMAHKAFMAGV